MLNKKDNLYIDLKGLTGYKNVIMSFSEFSDKLGYNRTQKLILLNVLTEIIFVENNKVHLTNGLILNCKR